MYFFQRLRDFDADHFFKTLLIFLGLSRLSCLCTKAVYEFFKLIDFLLLLFVFSNQGFEFNLADFFVVGKVSRVTLEVAVKKLVNLVDCYVKKVAVVADKQKSAAEVLQKAFKPVSRLNIKIVGRFVQKKNVRILHKGFGKGNTHLPAA